MALQELGHMPRHRRIAGVGQSEADQAAATRAMRRFVGVHAGEEAVDDQRPDFVAVESDRPRTCLLYTSRCV